MIDVWLRAVNEEIAKLDAQMDAPFLVHPDDYWVEAGHGWALLVIGPVVNVPAVYDEDLQLITPAVIDERWHANLRLWDHGDKPYATNFVRNFRDLATLTHGTEIIWPTTPSISWF